MNEKNKKMLLLDSAPIPKALLALGIPTMIGMMINALYNLVDAYFVADLGKSQMGAISVAFPFGQIIVGLGLLFGNGAGSYISRLLGRGDKEKANKVASTSLYSSVIIGAVFVLLSILFLNPILQLIGTTESILPYAKEYSIIYIGFSIFNIFNVTMNNIVSSEGAARTTMFALLSGAILNMILDPIFIYTLHLGVSGAAIASAVSQFISSLVYLTYIFKKKGNFNFHMKECTFSKEIISEIMKIGIPTMIFQLLTSLSIAIVNKQSKIYGDSVIAGMGAVVRITSMGSLMVFGFIKGFQPIAGYSYGAKKLDRLKNAIKTSVLWSTIFCIVMGLILTFFSSDIISQFSKGDAQVLYVGSAALRANGISFMVFGFYTVYSSLLLALGKGKEGFLLGACRQGICFLPLILILPAYWKIDGIMYSQPIADVISAIIAAVMAIRIHKQLFCSKELINSPT